MITKYNAFVVFATVVAMILVIEYYPRSPVVTPAQQDIVQTVPQAQASPASVTKEELITTPDPITLEPPTENFTETLPEFNVDTLAVFDGTDASLPIYVAFEGSIYDVTEGKKFYGPDGHYHFLAGTDGTKLLKVFGGSTIQEKYPVVGTFVK